MIQNTLVMIITEPYVRIARRRACLRACAFRTPEKRAAELAAECVRGRVAGWMGKGKQAIEMSQWGMLPGSIAALWSPRLVSRLVSRLAPPAVCKQARTRGVAADVVRVVDATCSLRLWHVVPLSPR